MQQRHSQYCEQTNWQQVYCIFSTEHHYYIPYTIIKEACVYFFDRTPANITLFILNFPVLPVDFKGQEKYNYVFVASADVPVCLHKRELREEKEETFICHEYLFTAL